MCEPKISAVSESVNARLVDTLKKKVIQATYLSLLQWSRWSKMPEPPPQKCSKPGCDFVTPDGCPTWDHTLTPVMPLQCPLSLLPANLSPSYRRPLLHSILLFHHLIPCLVISYLWSGILICNKTKGVSVQLVDLLKSPIFIVQKAATQKMGRISSEIHWYHKM